MAIVEKTINQIINVNKQYKISIIIGQGQLGQVAFRKPDGSKINRDEVDNLEIGSGLDLLTKGKLNISSMVSDVQPATNKTSILIKLNDEEIGYFEEDTDRDNGSVFYEIEVIFNR